VTDPLPALPPNAVDDARKLLHAELVGTFVTVGWSTEGRALAYPPITPPTPGGWVDVPTLSAQGAGLVLTFPIGVAVDGNERSQVERLDALLAILWQRLEAVKIPGGLRLTEGSTLQVMTAGPEPLEIGGGPTVRSVALVAQVPVSPRTLCPTALTGENTP
jgi:hypothetical protein